MKKIVFIFFVIISFSASAQRYTLQFGQRECTFYYWDRHWIDHCSDSGTLVCSLLGGTFNKIMPRTFLRFCTTQDTLKIIGIAGACNVHKPLYDTWGRWENVYDPTSRFPEYFQLYDAVDTIPVFVAETRWDTAHPRYQIVGTFYRYEYDTTYYPGHGHGENVPYIDSMPIYEAFFDKPILVTDSFYVGGTTYNSMLHYDESTNQYIGKEHWPTEYLCMDKDGGGLSCIVTPHNYYTYRVIPNAYAYPSLLQDYREYTDSDTNWHQMTHNSYTPGYWMCIFPIIDTTGMGLDGFQWVPGYGCDIVRTFRLLYVEGRQAYLSWSGNRDAAYYEVSYGPEGTAPDQGTKVRTNTSMVCLDSLEPGRRYVAYARTRCTNDAYGGWSDSVSFRIPGSGSAIEDASLASRFTEVMPNPATTQATVISSFTINRIEVYTAAGQHVLTTEPKANAAALDLSTLSAGTYLLRIQTSAGDTAKKLTVIKN